jgi:NADH-quinone oxidoreductase subunit L
MELSQLAIWIMLLPLISSVLAATLGPRWLRERTHWVVIAGVGGASALSFVLLQRVAGLDPAAAAVTHRLFRWFSSGATRDPWLWFDLRIDALTAVILVTVTFVATCVVVYSRDYMRHDGHAERGYERFFAFLGLFVFSMCALVLAGNFLLLYLGWEAVGLCSYLLIGFYYQRPAAAAAAKKAFLVNRVGDFGFGLGVLLIYQTVGSLDYSTVFAAFDAAFAGGGSGNAQALAALLQLPPDAAGGVLQAIQERTAPIALLLLCGAVGKSAQIPLYVWLPDAMEGPSPVSALIHAATMVTAGVYMLARCGAIFAQSEMVMTTVAWIGGATALMAATMALAQYDLKRILAYSTISQLGYMFMGLGVYAADAAVFHLFTHAFFKALLFLAAGSVMHALGGVIDVREFGGLGRIIPWTCRAFAVGALALAGFPYLFSGFYSKDLILHAALDVRPLLGVIGLVTAALTAFYTFRAFFLAFSGQPRLPQGVQAHESGPWMLAPLAVLSVGAVGAGFLFKERLPAFLGSALAPFPSALQAAAVHGWHVPAVAVGLISGAIAIAGIALAYLMYVAWPDLAVRVQSGAGRLYHVLLNKYYVDEACDWLIVRRLRRLGQLFDVVDRLFIDGLVWLVTAVPRLLGLTLQGLQRGSLQGYGVTMAAGFGLLLAFFVFYSGMKP